jgi:hypothetical protein
MEHLTTREGADFVREARAGVAGTITPQHLLWNRNALFRGGLRPHAYCLPVLKREVHRLALVAAATSGNPKFFLGTDSAPHARGAKESDCGCAGVYSAHAAIELYAEAFDLAGALDKLEGFASFHGPDFYGLPRNADQVTLRRESWTVPAAQAFGDSELVPIARRRKRRLAPALGAHHSSRNSATAPASWPPIRRCSAPAHAFLVRRVHLDVVHVGVALVAVGDQSRGTGVVVVHVRHEVGDLFDVLDALDRLECVQQHAHVVVAGGVADPYDFHVDPSLRRRRDRCYGGAAERDPERRLSATSTGSARRCRG